MKLLNFSKKYIIDKSFSATKLKLTDIVSKPFASGDYNLFGNILSDVPPKFLLLGKWWMIGLPLYAHWGATQLIITLYEQGGKTRILLNTKTNFKVYVFFFIVIILAVISIFQSFVIRKTEYFILHLFLAIVILAIDRLVKNILISNFEETLGIYKPL